MDVAEDRITTIACANIDRLITVEMRRSDYSRGVIAKLHAAAQAAQGEAPLSLLGARFLQEKVVAGRVVLITTGAGHPDYLPAGETDGPPGAAVLARLVTALGGVPILLTEAAYVNNMAATALAAGLGLRSPEVAQRIAWTTAVLPLSAGADAQAEAEALLARFDPSLLISIEKLGPNAAGIAHSASGTPTGEDRARGMPVRSGRCTRHPIPRHRRQRQRARIRQDPGGGALSQAARRGAGYPRDH